MKYPRIQKKKRVHSFTWIRSAEQCCSAQLLHYFLNFLPSSGRLRSLYIVVAKWATPFVFRVTNWALGHKPSSINGCRKLINFHFFLKGFEKKICLILTDMPIHIEQMVVVLDYKFFTSIHLFGIWFTYESPAVRYHPGHPWLTGQYIYNLNSVCH